MALDPLKTALDPAKLGAGPGELPGKPDGLDALSEPLAAFLNPETGQATAVKPDPAGWPKAEVSPGLPFAEDEGGPDLIAKALQEGGAGAPPEAPAVPGQLPEAMLPDLPGLEPPKPKVQAPGAQPVQLNNPETGEVTKIAPDDAGWPKAEVGQGLPEDLPELPDLPGKDLLEGKAPKAPDLALDGAAPDLPKVELPGGPEVPSGAPKITQIEGLETGDLTTITPDSAGWPKADVKPGGLPELPEGLPKDLPEQLTAKPPEAPEPPDLLDQIKDKI